MSKTYVSYEQTASQGSFRVTIDREFSDMEHRLMLERGGAIEIDLGGSISETVPVYGAVTMTLAENLVDFPDDFPVSFMVKAEDVSDDYALAQAQVVAWRMNAIDVITAALQARWTDTGDLEDFIVETEEEIVST